MDSDAQVGIALRHGCGHVGQLAWLHRVGAQALQIHAHHRSSGLNGAHSTRADPADPVQWRDVWVRQYYGFSAPSPPDLGGCGLGEGHDGICFVEEKIEALRMGNVVLQVRVSQVVDGHHQRDPAAVQLVEGGPRVVQRHLLDTEVHVDDVDSAKGCLASYRVEERRRPPETVSTGDLRKDYQPVVRLTLGTDRADDIWVVGGHASHGEPGCGAVAMAHLSSVAPVAVPNHPHRGGPSRRSPGVRWSRGRQPGQRRAAVCQRFRRHNSAVSPVAKLVHAA